MREIKFRAWDIEENVMHEWCPTFFSDMSPVTGYSSGFPDGGHTIILMQYTGRKDKNGKEIYEGDIVRTTCCDCDHVVVMDEYRWSLTDFVGGYDWTGREEVVGNVHENPELLA